MALVTSQPAGVGLDYVKDCPTFWIQYTLTIFAHAIELEPEHAYAYQYKAYILYRLKRHEEALVVCEQAIQLDPEDADIYDTKGDILQALERHEEAQQAYGIAKQHEEN